MRSTLTPGNPLEIQESPIFWSTDRSTFKADIARRPPTAPKSQNLSFDEE